MKNWLLAISFGLWIGLLAVSCKSSNKAQNGEEVTTSDTTAADTAVSIDHTGPNQEQIDSIKNAKGKDKQ